MTIEELLARIRSEGSGMREAGTRLKKTSSEERFALEDLFNQFKETESVAGAKDVSRKRRKSGFRLKGGLLGAGAAALAALFTGGAITPFCLQEVLAQEA